VLAIGTGATRWFQRLGFPEESVFEFAYFPPAPLDFAAPFENVWPPDTVRLLYVGQLIRRKGIDFLLDALAGIDGDSWHLDLVGTGSEEPELRRLSEELGISNRVTFLGPMSNANAMAVINTADTLVLASRFDGYGAVVNEALLRGVPVICSTNCGARQAITGPELGTVFHSGSVQSLRDAIRNWLARGPQTEAMKAARRLLAAGLSPHAGAAYFLNILRYVYGQGPRPIPPWQCDRTRSGDGFSAVRD
jgi:glycosyltransferase involved in cell wall biosynthesis